MQDNGPSCGWKLLLDRELIMWSENTLMKKLEYLSKGPVVEESNTWEEIVGSSSSWNSPRSLYKHEYLTGCLKMLSHSATHWNSIGYDPLMHQFFQKGLKKACNNNFPKHRYQWSEIMISISYHSSSSSLTLSLYIVARNLCFIQQNNAAHKFSLELGKLVTFVPNIVHYYTYHAIMVKKWIWGVYDLACPPSVGK